MHSLAWVVLVLTSGFTVSAIVANLYRISGFAPASISGHFVRVVILMFAGPSEIFESAITARMKREGTAFGFWLTIIGICYWSLVLGLAVVHGAEDLTMI